MLDINQVLDEYADWCGNLSPRTVRKMRHELNRWNRHSACRDLQRLTPATYQAFRQSCLQARLSAATIEGTVSTVATLVRFAHERGLIAKIPSVGRKLKRRSAGPPRQPTLHDLSAMWLHCGAATWPRMPWIQKDEYWRAYLAMGYFTGLRLDDLAVLDWAQVDLVGERLQCRPQKTGIGLMLPLHSVAVSALKKLPRGTKRVFLRANQGRYVRRSLAEICAAAHVPRITPKQLRCAAETAWESAELGAGELLLGHSQKSSGRHYADRQAVAFSILTRAMPKVAVPPSWNGHQQKPKRETELLAVFSSLAASDQETVLRVCRSLAGV